MRPEASSLSAKDLGEIAKLKAEILGVQSDINAALLELGRKTYEQSKSEAEGPYVADCTKITGLYDQIESLVKSDNSDDNNCIINTDETPAESVEEQPTAEESSAPTVCPACGQPVESGSAFCSQCGAKL